MISSARFARLAGPAIALLALGGLVLRYCILLSDAMNFGESPWDMTGNFFSYFTVLSNVLVVAVFLFPAAWCRSPRTRASLTLYMVVVGAVYEAMLRRMWHLEGFQFLASFILHDAVPLAVLLHWILTRKESALRWTDPIAWLAFPLGYLAFALARGVYMDWWAYPFLDASQLGFERVFLNALALVALFIFLGLVMVAWDRRDLPTSPAPETGLDESSDLVELPSAQSV